LRLLNGEINRQKKEQLDNYDYKRDLKSKEYIAAVVAKIIPTYQILVDGNTTESFSKMWDGKRAVAKV
jgi:hypothetical protein